MLKGIPNRVIYMAASIFKNKYEELKKYLLWSIFNQTSTSFSGSKDMLVGIVKLGRKSSLTNILVIKKNDFFYS